MLGSAFSTAPKPGSWQGIFAKGGGCLNEYGPHVIDLCCFIFGQVSEVKWASFERAISENADDRTNFSLLHRIAGDKDRAAIPGEIILDWTDLTKRKSVIEIFVQFEGGAIRADNSAIEIVSNVSLDVNRRFKIDYASKPDNVDFYLRGEEFSLQLENFLKICNMDYETYASHDRVDFSAKLSDAIEVDRIIEEISIKAGLK
jgi:predicted dehydrogenase